MFLLIFGALLHPGACLFSQLDRLQQQQQLFSKQIAELTAQYAELKGQYCHATAIGEASIVQWTAQLS